MADHKGLLALQLERAMGKEQVRWLTIVVSPRCVVQIELKQSQEVGLLPVEAVSVQDFALAEWRQRLLRRETPKTNKTVLVSCVGSPNFSEASWGTSLTTSVISRRLAP